MSVGSSSAARPYPVGQSRTHSGSLAASTLPVGWNHTCHSRASVKRMSASFLHCSQPPASASGGLILLSAFGLSPEYRRSSSYARPPVPFLGSLRDRSRRLQTFRWRMRITALRQRAPSPFSLPCGSLHLPSAFLSSASQAPPRHAGPFLLPGIAGGSRPSGKPTPSTRP